MSKNVSNIAAFLNAVGIQADFGYVPDTSFVPNVTIKNGAIVFNAQAAISDLLHEAGHLAIIPAKYRAMCQADAGKSLRVIWKKAEAAGEIEVDSYMFRSLIQCGDPEATAWAFAAGKALGVPDEVIILKHQYENAGADIRFALAANCYAGINGLRAAGMVESVRSYPHLTRWVQP